MRKLLIALLLSTSAANAGWFGPSDYRECVLNEMNGKPRYLLSIVRGLCNKRFPCAELAICNDKAYDSEGRSVCIDWVWRTACAGGNLDD